MAARPQTPSHSRRCLHPLLMLLLAVVFLALAAAPASATNSSRAKAPKKTQPPALPWRDFTRLMREAGCVTTSCSALKAFYGKEGGLCLHNDGLSRPASWRSLCCRPVVLVTTRVEDCPSCAQVWGKLRSDFEAEYRLLEDEYVTFVDAGDPLRDALLRSPFPLPLPFTMEDLITDMHADRPEEEEEEKERANGGEAGAERQSQVPVSLRLRQRKPPAAAADPATGTKTADVALPDAAREDLRARERALARRVAAHAFDPAMLYSHQWEPYVRAAFVGQGDYVFRTIFLYPHNGSLMQDIANDNVRDGLDTNIHFFGSVGPFFDAIKKSVLVMKYAMQHEILAHCG